MYTELAAPRFSLEDHLGQVKVASGFGLPAEEHAAALGASVEYVNALRDFLAQFPTGQ
jgi:hypothetical protein